MMFVINDRSRNAKEQWFVVVANSCANEPADHKGTITDIGPGEVTVVLLSDLEDW